MSLERKIAGLGITDWTILLFFALLRFLLSFRYSLGVDEAHYALYGLRMDWSYFDHPPLVGWINSGFIHLLGRRDWVPRLPANIAGILSSYLLFKLTFQMSKNLLAARWSVIALNTSFLCFGLFLMFLPDTILLPLILWLIFVVNDLLNEDSWRNWLRLAIGLGLCALTKYTAILFLPSLVLIALTENRWRLWLSRKFLGASLIAILFTLPVIIWNVKNDWISFSYQAHHVVGQSQYSLKDFISSLAAQIIAYSPFLVVTCLCVMVLAKAAHGQLMRVSLWMIAPCFLFFSYSGLKGFALPHWTLIVYAVLFACAFAVGFSHAKWRKALQTATAVTSLLLLFVLSELFFNFIPFENYKTPYADVIGWHELHDQIKEFNKKHPELGLSIGVSNWTQGGRTGYYLYDVAPVFVLDDHFDQFDIWEKGKTLSQNVLLLRWRGFEFARPLETMCASSEVIQTNIFNKKKYAVTSVDLVLCRGFKAL